MNARITILLMVVMMLSLSCQAGSPAKFELGKGLNASHWLSQSEKRGEERANYMQEKDFKLMADLGFDHVRLPIDEEQMWDESGTQNPEAFELMHDAIGWAFKNNLRVIIDLHVLRSHHFNDADSRKLWEDKKSQEDFIKFWHQLSAELKKYPNDKLAYEPLNEAVAENPEDWNKLINWVIAEIRKLEPNRTIIMGSNKWQQVGTFKDLQVPENDKNIILSFHYYEPFTLTHYKAPWNVYGRTYFGPINYPGMAIDTTKYAEMDAAMFKAAKQYNRYADKQTIENEMLKAVTVAEKLGLPLYCGEWGCFPTTPIEMRQIYYRDMVSLFDKHGIAWAHWNYKNDFPVVDKDLKPISELLDIMVPK